MYYEKIFKELNRRQVRYLVVGGIAVNLYGVPRATMDLDLMVDLDRANLQKFIAALTELGFKQKLPVKIEDLLDPKKRRIWQQEKNMISFSLFHPQKPFQVVDIFVDNPIDFEVADRAKQTMGTGGPKIPVIGIDDLIILKQKAGRKQDLSDIEALRKIKELIDYEKE